MTMQSLSSKRGVALVLVLGILSVMTLLAVSFAISMRVERLAANSFEGGAQAKHLLDVALSEALLEIEAERLSNDQIYPQWPSFALASQGGGDDYTRILEGPAIKYLPDAVRADAMVEATNIQWIGVGELQADNGDTTSGRVAFLAVDCSGLIDYNFAGGVTRDDGSDVGEIAVSSAALSALDVVDVSGFSTLRSNVWKRFENVAELWTLGQESNIWVGGIASPTYATHYSYFPTGYLFNAAFREQFDISVTLPPQVVLEPELSDAGLTGSRAAQLTRSLIDYYDADNDPGNGIGLDVPCTEAVPMVNEIYFTNAMETASGSGGTNDYHNDLALSVELWYPFGDSNPEDYTVETRVAGVGSSQAGFNPQLPVAAGQQAVAGPWNFDEYRLIQYTLPRATVQGIAPPTPPTQLAIRVRVREDSTGILVDEVVELLDWASLTGLPQTGPPPAVGKVEGESDWETDDPRFNWDWDTQWSYNGGGPTLTNVNGLITVQDPGKDYTTVMYVRNAPMETIGEFGYLLYDETKPWTTCRMLGDDPDLTMNVLDRFSVTQNQRGFVNVNTPFREVLAASMVAAPLSGYPGDGSAVPVSEANALTVADEILGLSAGNVITNYSQLAGITDVALAGSLGLNVAEVEALFRNSIGLWRVRQNLYTIFLAAQTLKGGTVVAQKNAVAVVWQDPFPNAQPGVEHSAFIRFFHEIEELE